MRGPRMVRWSALALVALAALASDRAAGDDPITTLPIPVPDRPFLLVEAPRRFLPRENAEVRIQSAGAREVEVAVLRAHVPMELLALGRERQGMAIAQTAIGRESEDLIAAGGPLPRRGARLTLVARHTARVRPLPRRARVGAESEVYDSYEDEESDVQTWGVDSGEWADARVPLGRLAAGLYLVRVTYGAWAGSALLSVGENALLVRRGDLHDEIRVLGPTGEPRAGVRIEAREGASLVASGTTDAEGALRLPPSDLPQLRYVAVAGDDVAWADVAHARLSACDPRVYLGTGRPVFRRGETVHVRGHVRGCDAAGNERPLADEPIELSPGRDGAVEVRSDANGDFVAELIATGTLSATVRGHASVRDVELDERQLPERALELRLDRDHAAVGERVGVQVADADGGWPVPTRVRIRTPEGVRESAIGPGRPATASFVVPATDEILTRAEIVATLTSPGRVQTARAELWIGRRDQVVELQAARAWGRSGETIPVRVVATDLGGAPEPGPIALAVRATNGNGPGPVRWTGSAVIGADGARVADVVLAGEGPWWIEASRAGASASLVVRDRPGPPSLGTRGELAIQPAQLEVEPGGTLDVDVRLEPGSAAWVTLEQGSVHASTLVRGRGGIHRARLPVPRVARGLATVVATEVRGAIVQSASATVEVATSRAFELAARTDRRSYAEGERAHVTLEARDRDGGPRDAVVSVWMADAGYWELGDERYPRADAFFRLPGRPASAGDGSTPVAYGADEGRVVDAWMEWNGARVERATHRHAWEHGGRLVRFAKQGDAGEVATELARAAGLEGARVCREAIVAAGRISLEVHDLPWDLVALRMHDRLSAALAGAEVWLLEPYVQGRVLVWECPEGGGGTGMGSLGSGRGAGGAAIRTGAASIRDLREERLEGTLFFLGLAPLGPDGTLEIDVPLPAHPGRWRIEALAIAGDGAGASASATVHTTRAIVATVRAPAHLREGDETEAEIEILAPTRAGREASIEVMLPRGLEAVGAIATSATLDAQGRARVPARLRATQEGAGAIEVRTAIDGERDGVRAPVTIAGPATRQPIALRAVVGPDATEARLPLPTTLRDVTLRVHVGTDVADAIRAEVEALRAPRWDVAVLRMDRLGALASLRRAAAAMRGQLGSESAAIAAELDREIVGEAAAILRDAAADAGGDGSVSWWAGAGRDPAMTAALAYELGDASGSALDLGGALDAILAARRRGEITAGAAPVAAAALARAGYETEARELLSGSALGDLDAMVWALRAALALHDPVAPYAARIEAELDGRLASADPVRDDCAGEAWFLCLSRGSERAQLARAAEALLVAGRSRDRAARVAARIATHPVDSAWWSWGESESDVIALVARLEGATSAHDRVEVARGDRTLASVDGDAMIVVPAGTGDLVLRLARARGRFATLRVDGEVDAAPAEASAGSVPLERRLVSDRGERFVEIEFTLRAAARDLAIAAPLPAGLELGMRAGGGQLAVRAEGRAWNWWTGDPDPGPEVPRLERSADGIELRWSALRPGRYVVRVPVVVTARGSFGAGSAILRTADATAWGLTRPLAASF